MNLFLTSDFALSFSVKEMWLKNCYFVESTQPLGPLFSFEGGPDRCIKTTTTTTGKIWTNGYSQYCKFAVRNIAVPNSP